MSLRVYELAKELEISSQELCDILKKLSINKDAVSTLTNEEEQKVREYFEIKIQSGDELENTITCKKCGTELPRYAKFCFKCGEKVEHIIQTINEQKNATDSTLPFRPIGLASELCVPTPILEEAMKMLEIHKGLSDFLTAEEEKQLRLCLSEVKKYEIRGISDSVLNMKSSYSNNTSNDTEEKDVNYSDAVKTAYYALKIAKMFFGS